MKKEYSAPIAELFEAELEGMIAVSKPGYDVDIQDPEIDPPFAESKTKGYNPIFDME